MNINISNNDNVINFLAMKLEREARASQLAKEEKDKKTQKAKKKKSALSIKADTSPEETSVFSLDEVITGELIDSEPISGLTQKRTNDNFSSEIIFKEAQKKLTKAQTDCLTAFETYQKFMLDNDGFAEILEERLYKSLNRYKRVREEYINLAKHFGRGLFASNQLLGINQSTNL